MSQYHPGGQPPGEAAKSAYPQLTFEARPKHIRDQTRSRLNQFIGGHYSSQNLSSLLFAHRIDSSSHPKNVEITYWSAPGRSKPGFEEAKRMLAGHGKEGKKGMEFGPSWTNHWFKIKMTIPPAWKDHERIQLEFDCSGEALIFTPEGLPLHGLTGGYGTERRVEHIIPPRARETGMYEVYLEHSSNGMFGIDNMDPPDPNRYYRLNSADLVVPNMEAWRLMWDFNTLKQLTESLPWDTPLPNQALFVANEMMNTFKQGSLESVKECRKLAEKVLGRDWEGRVQESRKRRGKKEGKDRDGTLWGVGHCHIDTAWLWPFSVTQQKSARSWSTQIDLMERYPEHRFSCTQAQQYKWLEQLYPQLYEKVKAKVETGQFQPVGATWVEMDTNMPSGEALCRQFLYGQRYFQNKFGFRSPTFVLPDTFGYSSQLPQIARLSGCENFFTQKLSWNSINNFPHSTFNWVGLDGTQILTHMTPVNSYNAQCDINEIRAGQAGNKNLEVTKQALILFGNGDGGGGPTPPMLEKLRRARALVTVGEATTTDIPLVKMGGSFDEFFESIKEETDNGAKLPNWRGELYFELHRGTYTTQALVKRGNRKGELLLRQVEYTATLASLIPFTNYVYPKKDLDEAWEELLLCQFHDCLPGSGIRLIYDDVWSKHRKVLAIGSKLLEAAQAALYPGSKLVDKDSHLSKHDYDRLVIINPTPWLQRRELVQAGSALLSVYPSGQEHDYKLPSTKEVSASEDAPWTQAKRVGDQSFTLSNRAISMKIEDGRITSLFDNQLERELIPEKSTGGFIIFEDQPANWDAWDADIYHLEKFTRLTFSNVSIAENGHDRASLKAMVETGSSKIEIKITLDAESPSLRTDGRSPIRFDAIVDWRERHKFLKFELPLDIHSDNATYHTQFGIVQRPTHRNTSWDAAKFEVCGHQFADLSEYGYGVAILNDSKYGYATEGNVMRLSLLRAPTMPDADADQGTHQFAFAIYPHIGTFAESDVAEVAEGFNAPLSVRHYGPGIKPTESSVPFRLSGDAKNVVLETVKRGEDDGSHSHNKTIVLRLYERLGGHAKTKLLLTGYRIQKASVVNILEDEVAPLKLLPPAKFSASKFDYEIPLSFRGFEIKTVKIELAPSRQRSLSCTSDNWVKVEA